MKANKYIDLLLEGKQHHKFKLGDKVTVSDYKYLPYTSSQIKKINDVGVILCVPKDNTDSSEYGVEWKRFSDGHRLEGNHAHEVLRPCKPKHGWWLTAKELTLVEEEQLELNLFK